MGSKNQARNATMYLYEKQGGKCFYCDTEMFLLRSVEKKHRKLHRAQLATFDHIKLKSEGGTYARHNGVCACFKCNGIRGDLPQEMFIEHFDFVTAEWEKGNRSPSFIDGELVCIPSKKFKKMKRNKRKKQNSTIKGAFIVARFAGQIGKTVEDIFTEYVYNSTYDLVRDLE